MDSTAVPGLWAGTAGWSYKDWEGVFYPAGAGKGFDFLRFYAEYFNTVEVNATYYAYLRTDTAHGWVRKTEEKKDFSFIVKLHGDFTHKRQFGEKEIAAMKGLLDVLAAAGKLGGVLIQFPYSFAGNAPNAAYVTRLNKVFEGYNRFLEVRHASWNTPETQRACEDMGMTLCTIDQPQIGESLSFTPAVLNGVAYVRLHGRNKEAWKHSISQLSAKRSYLELHDPLRQPRSAEPATVQPPAEEDPNARYKYLYTRSELAAIAAAVYKAGAREVYVITNNHPQGYAVANAFELMHLLGNRAAFPVPDTALQAFPMLRELAG